MKCNLVFPKLIGRNFKSLFFGIALLGLNVGLYAQVAAPGGVKDAPKELNASLGQTVERSWALAIHGGAGGAAKGSMTPEQEKKYTDKLSEALKIGSDILSKGGRSLDAVEAVVKFMEDCPLFNAGKGAVLNADGKAELDASVMDGATGMAGAVAGVTTVRNPVSAARMVMEKTPHVMLAGAGAEEFARAMKLAIVDPSWFITPERQDAWKKWKEEKTKGEAKPAEKLGGTVGAVALDLKGNLAAATSTGGTMGKMPGRIGDSPVIGAGTWASRSCAVSCTGQGEFFLRNLIAYDVAALMKYKEMPLEEAARYAIEKTLTDQKGSGGLIAIDRKGTIAMPFNTSAMFRGWAKSGGQQKVEIY